MKQFIIVAVFLAAAACSSKKPQVEEPKPGPDPVATGGVPCEQEIALTCAAGAADGCVGAKTTIHACVAEAETAGPPCEQEIAKECPAGQKDACLATPVAAANHICVFTP